MPAITVGAPPLHLLRDVITAILPRTLYEEARYIDHVLIRIFVVAHHLKLPRHQWSWIDICRKTNVDPGQLTKDHTGEFMNGISQKWWPVEKVYINFNEDSCLE